MPQSSSGATPDGEIEITSSEANRLAALRHYEILDTEAEPAFDEFALLAARLYEAPIALITLLDEDREWFKSKVGVSINEAPRLHSFSDHTIQQRAVFTIDEASRDKRFSANPLVESGPYVCFYAGAPLVTRDGHAIGTICVMDWVSRELTTRQLELLQILSRQVMNQLELRLERRELEKTIKARDHRQAILHRNEWLLNTILEALPVSVSYLNTRTELQLANPADEALWAGSKQPAAQDVNRYKLWRAAQQQQMRDQNWGVVRAISEGTVTLQELKEIECWDGTHKTVLHSAVPLRDAEQRILGAIAVNEDITALKQMEAILRETRTWFRQVVENINEVFWMTNFEKTQFLHVSPAFEEIWGRPCKDLYDTPNLWIESIHPEDRERVLGSANAHRHFGGELKQEFRIIRPDGSVRWVRDQTFPVRGEGGKVARWVGIATDITEQRETEELLRQSENEFRVMFESAPFGMALVDPEGYPIKPNPALQRLLGYSEEELRCMTFNEITHPEDVEKGWSRELLEGKREDYQIEKRFIRKDKEVVSVRLTVSPVRGTKADLYTIWMVEDITEKKNLENQFVQAQRLESTEILEAQAMCGRGELVLVVDDEAAVVALTSQMLEAYGYKVLTADNGMDAIAICAGYKDTLQVVITDMLMPGMDGADLIRNLLEINPVLRAIVVSGAINKE